MIVIAVVLMIAVGCRSMSLDSCKCKTSHDSEIAVVVNSCTRLAMRAFAMITVAMIVIAVAMILATSCRCRL